MLPGSSIQAFSSLLDLSIRVGGHLWWCNVAGMTSEASESGTPPVEPAVPGIAVEAVVVPGMKELPAKGAFWIAVTRAIGNLVTFLSMLFLAGVLVPADFGLVAIASTIGMIILAVPELSLASALVYQKAPTDEHFHTAFSLNLLRGIVLAAIILWLIAACAGVLMPGG
jgi:hypothetical protein